MPFAKDPAGRSGNSVTLLRKNKPMADFLERDKLYIARDFDIKYYRHEYPDVELPPEMLIEHFCECGWREGRNPGPYFDTVTYLMRNNDVAAENINPYYHYLFYGIDEGRNASPAATPSVRTNLLFNYSFVDWVARLRPHVDEEYYAAYLPASLRDGIDLAAHFAYRGWREGLSPNSKFDIRKWSQYYPEAKRLLVNPLLIRLEEESGAFRSLPKETVASRPVTPAIPTPSPEPAPSPLPAEGAHASPPGPDPSMIETVRAEFSSDYYLSQNRDVEAAGIDPVLHYVQEGWKEGRNPNKDFDTAYYLAANQDVAAAGINPFWHFLVEGRREGRQPSRPGGHRRRTIDAARPPEKRTEGYVLPTDEPSLDPAALLHIETTLASAGAGTVVALSHDCYIRSVGGTQIFISDEQTKFNAAGFAYLQISPMTPRLALAPAAAEFIVRVVLDGTFLGLCPIDDLTRTLARSGTQGRPRETLVLHSVLGFNAGLIARVRRALNSPDTYFWLHDYSSLCAGFNLLRNDVEFCNAPPPDSMACRVCICGPGRADHLAEMRHIFEECHPTVLAPSQLALDLWRARTDLPCRDARVHWHWHLRPDSGDTGRARQRDPDRVIAVAFVGVPLPSKGWGTFSALIDQRREDPRYRFLHFVAPGQATVPGVEVVPTTVTRADRRAAIDLLRQHGVDLVLVLSTWPETFSFVAYEALVAGAYLVCLPDSGNVAAAVRRTGRGRVLADEAALLAFFAGDGAHNLVGELDAQHLPELQIEDAGTTATIVVRPALGKPRARVAKQR